MRALLPYLALYKRHKWMLTLGVALAILTLLASIGLLTLSGWFLSASAVAGFAGLYSFNYMLPAAGVRGTAITRTAGRYFERLVSHDATFRVLQHLRVDTFSKLLPLSPAGLARYRQGELLNRVVADVDTLDHLYLRVISPLVGAFVVIVVVTLGLSLLDVHLALVLGGIMLLTLFLLPPLFYRAGKTTGQNLTHLRGEYRQQLTAWLQGQAELTVFGASQRYRHQMENTELNWHEAQRKQSELTALSQALMLLIGGVAVVAMLWLAAGGVGDNNQPGALIALFVFCALAAFEALAPVTGAFQHLGQVIASALRITEITGQTPEVRFSETSCECPARLSLTLENVSFSYDDKAQKALDSLNLNIPAGAHVAVLGRTGCGKSTLLQLLTRAWDPHEGLNSWLGEGGRQLSGGELRRLAIARALLHDAPLMLLDEPTEGLDATTESQILDLLAKEMRGKTLVMVTHRLRGLAALGQIIVMDNGHIIEQGSHAELLAKQGRYYQFKQRL